MTELETEICKTAVADADGVIVVVAKCPVPGKCKTRLIPLLGAQGSAQLAKAMLCDILKALGTCVSVEKSDFG
jgi:glycosyltransferase A (GT-A) superfamily protein (DUF2064 family)